MLCNNLHRSINHFHLLQSISRLSQGYLPFDSSGDTIFKLQEVLATAFSYYILYAIYGPYKTSYNQDVDTIKSYYLVIFAAVMAIFFHSNLNRTIVADYGWAFTQYLETVAILSQFILFTKKVSIFLFREEKSKHTLLTLWPHKQFQEFYPLFSGFSLTASWMNSIVRDRHQFCPNTSDIGSCSPKLSISSSWPTSCTTGLRPSEGERASSFPPMCDHIALY